MKNTFYENDCKRLEVYDIIMLNALLEEVGFDYGTISSATVDICADDMFHNPVPTEFPDLVLYVFCEIAYERYSPKEIYSFFKLHRDTPDEELKMIESYLNELMDCE